MTFPEPSGKTATFEFEGAEYEYDTVAIKSLAVGRAMHHVQKDSEALFDVWEAVFGANADAYWSDIASDEKAAELLAAVYQARSKN